MSVTNSSDSSVSTSGQSPGALPWPPARQAWTMIIVMTLAYVFSFIDRMIFGLLITPIRAEFAINDTVFSLLYGLGFAFFYTVVGVPLGAIADRYNRRNLAAIGIAAWSIMTAACGLARSFVELALARIAVGVGEATLTPATYSMAGDSFPPQKLGRALSVFVIGWPLGIGLALIIGGLVIQFVAGSPIYHLPLIGTVKSCRFVFWSSVCPAWRSLFLRCYWLSRRGGPRRPQRIRARVRRFAISFSTGRHIWR